MLKSHTSLLKLCVGITSEVQNREYHAPRVTQMSAERAKAKQNPYLISLQIHPGLKRERPNAPSQDVMAQGT